MRQQIDGILANLDFGLVQKPMRALEWGHTGDPSPPSIDRLKACAVAILQSVAKDDDEPGLTLHAGFHAWRCGDCLYQQFVIEQAFAELGKPKRL